MTVRGVKMEGIRKRLQAADLAFQVRQVGRPQRDVEYQWAHHNRMVTFDFSPMKSLILLTLCSLAVVAQTAPDPVVVTIDGKDWTQSAFSALVRGLRGDIKKGYEANKRVWLDQYALMTRLAEYAKKEGLDQQEPYKQQIEYNNL